MLCGLIGKKLGHSYSKQIHEELGRYGYDLIETEACGLEAVLADRRYDGFNVTIPYKREVMRFCDELSDSARSIGSVNTLSRTSGGGLRGHNTDFEGFCAMARRAGIDFAGKKALILGSGGTSRTAFAAASASGAAEAVVVSRSGKVSYDDLPRHADAQIIVNTTPVGMYPLCGSSPVDLRMFPALTGVLDVVYNPLRTRLLQQASELGIPCGGGLYMLVRQAVSAAEIFVGEKLDGAADHVYKSLRAQVENIVLTGMPGSGKTCVGKIIAGKTGRRHIDTDELIVRKAGKSIPGIFQESGQERFREYEREAVSECGALSGVVISTGGGCVLNEDNRLNLRQNGRVYLVLRDIEKLATGGRPLSSGIEELRLMNCERMPLYKGFAQAAADNNGAIEGAADSILEEFYESACD